MKPLELLKLLYTFPLPRAGRRPFNTPLADAPLHVRGGKKALISTVALLLS